MPKKVYCFVGSRADKGNTVSLIKKVLKKIYEIEKFEVEIDTLEDFSIDMYGKISQSDNLEKLKSKILSCDIFLLGSPVYMHGIPGELKNIIDRLSDWAHTMRLAGKSVILFSTCNSNGHTTAIDTLHSYVLRLGGRVIGKYVSADVVPDLLNREDITFMTNSEITDKVSEIAEEIVIKWDTPFISNKFLETTFQAYKDIQLTNIENNYISEETEYWVSSGMINYNSFQEWVDIQV